MQLLRLNLNCAIIKLIKFIVPLLSLNLKYTVINLTRSFKLTQLPSTQLEIIALSLFQLLFLRCLQTHFNYLSSDIGRAFP